MGGSRVEGDRKRFGERRVEMSAILCVSQKRYAEKGARKGKNNAEE